MGYSGSLSTSRSVSYTHLDVYKRQVWEADWRLLLQLDVVDQGDFTLMFGDGGRLYFYMRKEDLQNRRFDRMWLIQQCG